MVAINEWLNISETSGTGDAVITLTANPSNIQDVRKQNLTIKTANSNAIVSVEQEGVVPIFIIQKDVMSYKWDGGSISNYIISNLNWDAVPSADWITISQTHGGEGKSDFSITIDYNITEENRYGKIDFFLRNTEQILGTITIAQTSEILDNSIIFYTTDDGQKLSNYPSTNGSFIANTYDTELGIGTLYYNTTITTLSSGFSSNLATVTLPDSVETIGNYAFRNTHLKSFKIPYNTKSLGYACFENCTYLKSIDLKGTITEIGERALVNTGLETLEIPSNITSIGNYALQDNHQLKSVVLPKGLTNIGNSAFNKCENLSDITIPESIQKVGKSAFNYCNLSNLKLPEKKTSTYLENGVFQVCTGFDTLHLGENWDVIPTNTFYNTQINTLYVEGADKYFGYDWNYNKTIKEVHISSIEDWLSYTYNEVGDNPLKEGVGLYLNDTLYTELYVPENVTAITASSFYNYSYLTKIVTNDIMTSITINKCENVTYTYIGENITSFTLKNIKGELVVNCNTKFSIPENVEKLTFLESCTEIKSSTNNCKVSEIELIGDKSLGDSCFAGLIYIKEIKGSEYITSIGYGVFQGCYGLERIDLPNLPIISERAFDNCGNLEFVTLSPKLTTIKSGAFHYCTMLKNITLPNSLVTIGDNDAIYEGAFESSGIERIVIPDSVTSIGYETFYNTPLKEVIIGNGLTSVGGYAFGNTPQLSYIKITALTAPSISSNTFKGTGEYGFLDYPFESIYSNWLRTDAYYLGYYKWNNVKMTPELLDFTAEKSITATLTNGSPFLWEITYLPVWITADVMSGGYGDTTITFTSSTDYPIDLEDEIIINYSSFVYKIKVRKYGLNLFSVTPEKVNIDEDETNVSITVNNQTNFEWSVETISTWSTDVSSGGAGETIVNVNCGDVYSNIDVDVVFNLNLGILNKTYTCKTTITKNPIELPEIPDNKTIYYTTKNNEVFNIPSYDAKANVLSNTMQDNGLGVIVGYEDWVIIPQKMFYNSNSDASLISVSLPPSVKVLDDYAFYGNEELITFNFGGNEEFINYECFSSPVLQNYTLPYNLRVVGSCSIGGIVYGAGAETLVFGEYLEILNCGSLLGLRNVKNIYFYGANPPQMCNGSNSSGEFGVFDYITATIHAPIGSDYSSVRQFGFEGDIIYDLEARIPDRIYTFEVLPAHQRTDTHLYYYKSFPNGNVTFSRIQLSENTTDANIEGNYAFTYEGEEIITSYTQIPSAYIEIDVTRESGEWTIVANFRNCEYGSYGYLISNMGEDGKLVSKSVGNRCEFKFKLYSADTSYATTNITLYLYDKYKLCSKAVVMERWYRDTPSNSTYRYYINYI